MFYHQIKLLVTQHMKISNRVKRKKKKNSSKSTGISSYNSMREELLRRELYLLLLLKRFKNQKSNIRNKLPQFTFPSLFLKKLLLKSSL